MKKSRTDIRRGVKSRIRKKVSGTTERPRLAVFRSLNHIYAQVIDDANGTTLAAASTTEKDLTGTSGGNLEAAQKVGKAIAERALSAGVSQVVFDRGGYVYHGRVKALIDATREAGLNKNQNNASDENLEDGKSTLDTVATTIGNIAGTVAGMIGNLVGDSTEAPAKKSDGNRGKKTDNSQAQADEVKEENNENE